MLFVSPMSEMKRWNIKEKKIDDNLCVCCTGKISSQFKPNLILSPILPEIIRPVKNRENSKSNYVEECWKGINQQHMYYITIYNS